jgi:hypothetical protein
MKPDVITVAVSRADGGLTVLRVVTAEYAEDGSVRWTIDPTPEYIADIVAKHNWQGPLAPVSWRTVPNEFVDGSESRSFRNAWCDDGGVKPGHDMVKARDIHMDRIRVERDKELERLDAEYMRADEQGNILLKQQLAAQKQTLRDLPTTFDLTVARTAEELDALWPSELPARSLSVIKTRIR